MKIKKLQSQLIQLPPGIALTLFLLKEELKSNKLLLGLARVGFDEGRYRSENCLLILEQVGLERSDDVMATYSTLLDRYTKKVDDDHKNIVSQAFNFYVDLVIKKRSFRKSGPEPIGISSIHDFIDN